MRNQLVGQTYFFSLILIFGALASHSVQAQSVRRNLDELEGWQVVDQPTPGTPEFALYQCRKSLAEGRYREADRQAEDWIDAHPNHSLLPEAYLVRAMSKEAREDYYKALFDYEFIARTFPASEAFTRALEREFEIGRKFARGTKRKLWGMRIAPAKEEAEELFIRIQERMPGSQLAERAGRELADYYYRERDMTMAATAYDLYIQNYPEASDRVDAMEQLVYSHLAKSKGPRFDPSGLYEADAWLETIERAHPAEAEQMGADALRARIRESDAARMLEDARWYMKRGDEPSARFILKRLLRKYPSTTSGRTAYRVLVEHGWVQVTADASTDSSGNQVAPENAESGSGPEDGSAGSADPQTDESRGGD